MPQLGLTRSIFTAGTAKVPRIVPFRPEGMLRTVFQNPLIFFVSFVPFMFLFLNLSSEFRFYLVIITLVHLSRLSLPLFSRVRFSNPCAQNMPVKGNTSTIKLAKL